MVAVLEDVDPVEVGRAVGASGPVVEQGRQDDPDGRPLASLLFDEGSGQQSLDHDVKNDNFFSRSSGLRTTRVEAFI